MHFLNYWEFPLLHLINVLFFEHCDVSVPVVAADYTAVFRTPLVKLVFNGVAYVVLDPLRLVFDQLVQIVYDDNAGDGSCVGKLLLDLLKVGNVHPVADAHNAAAAGVRRLDDVSEKPVFFSADFDDAGVFLLAHLKPFARKFRNKVGHFGVKSAAAFPAEPEKFIVPPDYGRIAHPEYGNGKGEISERVLLGVFSVIPDGHDILVERLFFFLHIDKRQYKHDDKHGRFKSCKQIIARKSGYRVEHSHCDEADCGIKFGKRMHFFVQNMHLLSGAAVVGTITAEYCCIIANPAALYNK